MTAATDHRGRRRVAVTGMGVKAPAGLTVDDCLVWNESLDNPATAFLAAQLLPPDFPTALGVFRSVDAMSYEDRVVGQIQAEVEKKGPGKLEDLLRSGDTWTVEAGAH